MTALDKLKFLKRKELESRSRIEGKVYTFRTELIDSHIATLDSLVYHIKKTGQVFIYLNSEWVLVDAWEILNWSLKDVYTLINDGIFKYQKVEVYHEVNVTDSFNENGRITGA